MTRLFISVGASCSHDCRQLAGGTKPVPSEERDGNAAVCIYFGGDGYAEGPGRDCAHSASGCLRESVTSTTSSHGGTGGIAEIRSGIDGWFPIGFFES